MKDFSPFFKKMGDNATAGELKTIFQEIEKNNPELAALKLKTTKDGMADGLRSFEAAHSDLCVPLRSDDQFYGVSGGKDKLSNYIQWIYIPAVKNASEEQIGTRNSALGKLLTRTVSAQTNFQSSIETIAADARQKYQTMLDANQGALDGISVSLQKKLSEWAHPDTTLRIEWEQDSNAAVKVQPPLASVVAGENGFEGKLARLGHGLQRSFLLALLQELSTFDSKDAPTLILGCEEPELYQHPPQGKHLAGVFERLAGDNSQILVTTHSPYFISGENFESVRMVRRDQQKMSANIHQYTFEALAKKFSDLTNKPIKNVTATTAKLHQALQPSLSEMFFTRKLVLVEGLEDVAYLQTWMILSNRWEEYRRSGVHIVHVNGKSELIRPAIIAKGLNIPLLVILDADGDKLMKMNKVTNHKELCPSLTADHKRDNLAMLKLFEEDETQVFPSGVLSLENLIIWPSDLADIVERESIVALGIQGAEQWGSMVEKAIADTGHAGDLHKNTIYVSHLLQRLAEAKAIPPSLDRACEKIVAFATS